MRVLICGGRQYQEVGFLWKTMDHIHATQPISEVIAGGAAGADTLGASWAIERGIPCRVFMADREKLGRSAGPIRNQKMLDQGKPDLVVAFPGERGTADMVRRARAAGVRILQPS